MAYRLRVGSVLEIPLSDGRKAFGRYVHHDKKMGQILQVFNHIINQNDELRVEDLMKVENLFEPIFVGLSGAVRAGIWTIVGYLPVTDYKFEGFLSATWAGNPPVVFHWSFYDGEKMIKLGEKLPEKYKKYEYIGGFAAPDIAKRIETGEESFVKKLIAGEIGKNKK